MNAIEMVNQMDLGMFDRYKHKSALILRSEKFNSRRYAVKLITFPVKDEHCSKLHS